MFKISTRDHRGLEDKAEDDIKHIRKALKKEPIIIKKFKEYGRNIDDIDDISIKFDKSLDVSAKTVNGDIFLNAKMLKDNWKVYFHYLVHECIHYLQHTSGSCNGHSDNENTDYLDNKSEIEAFQNQLKYREKTEDKSEVNQYIKDLFDKHNVPKEERPQKKKELLQK